MKVRREIIRALCIAFLICCFYVGNIRIATLEYERANYQWAMEAFRLSMIANRKLYYDCEAGYYLNRGSPEIQKLPPRKRSMLAGLPLE